MLIGVTGNIGTGKSRVAAYLGVLLEAPVLNADQICKELLEPGQNGYGQFVHFYGNRYLDENKCIKRAELRDALFKDKQLKEQIESILHPLVRQRVLETRKSLARGGVVIAEIPLLFESDWQNEFDLIVSVSAPAETSTSRVVKRDNTTAHDVLDILQAQLPQSEKDKLADTVIDNSAGWEATKKQIEVLAEGVLAQIDKDQEWNNLQNP